QYATVGGWTGDAYWTSTEDGAGAAWSLALSDGSQTADARDALRGVRCVRAAGCEEVRGSECADGTRFAGWLADVPLYTTPGDRGQYSFNKGSNAAEDLFVVGASDLSDGRANTALLVNRDDVAVPYRSAHACDDLVAHGHDD